MNTLEIFNEAAKVLEEIKGVEGKSNDQLREDNEKLDKLVANINQRLRELDNE